ncbi:small acid-soluble spore protein F (minor alpha/beta-type SASP) [Anaerosolibacter carboniphilus]|uniref:Small acid-soluble spore protein F (Minor alpha/beta-type SASP) n=1 Tax=Anaerosolibacter carboniphilus TaxID=1417629 RepID=A0A841KTU0_9FIRM|nr:small, acid-soluble spore protein, alpha/beta type [Anaerosolibacter carboniphilus]MBB6215578.1 small acid-soluble spore protein F (minor alpha/beta-type SASP) [Anaerosolibacter carboniphilus]
MENEKRGKIPERIKQEVAKELGVYDTVMREGGWGNVSSRDCGNIVKKTLERVGKG